jgi:hypothetical protein
MLPEALTRSTPGLALTTASVAWGTGMLLAWRTKLIAGAEVASAACTVGSSSPAVATPIRMLNPKRNLILIGTSSRLTLARPLISPTGCTFRQSPSFRSMPPS